MSSRPIPRAALLFHWKTLGRQIRIEGRIERASDAEADAYYATRARVSRLGAWASDQSRPLAARAELERRLAEYEARTRVKKSPARRIGAAIRVLPPTFRVLAEHALPPARPHHLHAGAEEGWTIGKLFP